MPNVQFCNNPPQKRCSCVDTSKSIIINKKQINDKDGVIKHEANALVLTCMDYRYVEATVNFLYGRNDANDFNYFVLAGASLGYNESKTKAYSSVTNEFVSPTWYQAYEDHIKLSVLLHNITEIVVIDHMDCGYYKAIYGKEYKTKAEQLHKQNINDFIDLLRKQKKYSKFLYEGILIHDEIKDGEIRFEVVYSDENKL